MMSRCAFSIWLDLCDGTTLTGKFVELIEERPLPIALPDGHIHETPQYKTTVTILSDTIGEISVNARHIVRMATDPGHPVETHSVEDVVMFVAERLN